MVHPPAARIPLRSDGRRRHWSSARGGNRTRMAFRPPAPQAGAYTISPPTQIDPLGLEPRSPEPKSGVAAVAPGVIGLPGLEPGIIAFRERGVAIPPETRRPASCELDCPPGRPGHPQGGLSQPTGKSRWLGSNQRASRSRSERSTGLSYISSQSRTLESNQPDALAPNEVAPLEPGSRKCKQMELNHHSPWATGLQPAELANAQCLQIPPVGLEPTLPSLKDWCHGR